jgi:hypothetical protein
VPPPRYLEYLKFFVKFCAGVAELVDARDLKSLGLSLCRFESGPRYQIYKNKKGLLTKPFFVAPKNTMFFLKKSLDKSSSEINVPDKY